MTTSTFLAINRGQTGTKSSDIVLRSSSSAGSDFEVRFNQTDANGAPCKQIDLQLALRAFKIFIDNNGNNIGGLSWPTI